MSDFASIVHPTDFSERSAEAFAHALRIALAVRGTLYILHAEAEPVDDMAEFPHVRSTLAQWGLMSESEPTQAIQERLGIRVAKVDLRAHAPVDGMRQFLKRHPADLLVLATEARQGIGRLLHGSVAERLAREAKAPALFVPARARGFVDPRRGEVHLRRLLVPVDHDPKPAAAFDTIMQLAQLLAGPDVEERLMHVGTEPPRMSGHGASHRRPPVALRRGDPVEAILKEADAWPADLIGMPTAGQRSMLDVLRGSTTERVVRQAPCPVLAVPAG